MDDRSTPGSDEPRAVEVLEAVASPDFLAAVFGRVGEPPPPPPVADAELAERIRIRDRALAAVDPALVDHLERHRRTGEALASPLPPMPPLPVERELAALDPRGLVEREIGEQAFLERPGDLDDVLNEATPQAILRDLHRPVSHFGDIALRPVALDADRTGARARAVVRAAMATRHHIEIGTMATGSQVMREEMRGLVETLARPWADSKPETPTPLASKSPGADDWRWFGLDGGYDPDL